MDDRHPSRTAAVSLLAALVAGTLVVQSQTPTFEAISIRPNAPPNALPIALLRGDRFFAPNTSVRDLIRVSYLVEDLQISGGPGWMDSDRFAIEATVRVGTTADDARAMMRAMLADRFKLTTHTEKRDLQGFVLTALGRGKSEGLRPSGPTCALVTAPVGIPVPPPPPPPPPGSNVTPLTAGTALSKCGSMLAPGWVSGREITMEQFATLLSRTLRTPVLNRTKMSGPYDIDLTYLPDTPGPNPTPVPVGADATSIFTAIQEQLGLKLESQRVPTDVIFIDRVERPTEN